MQYIVFFVYRLFIYFCYILNVESLFIIHISRIFGTPKQLDCDRVVAHDVNQAFRLLIGPFCILSADGYLRSDWSAQQISTVSFGQLHSSLLLGCGVFLS